MEGEENIESLCKTARAAGHQVVTGDPHFQDVKDAVYLGER